MARPLLTELPLRTSYHKGQDDIAGDFYLPCMARSVAYRRAVGFFRSTVFGVAWPALPDFVRGGGRMQILCSHVLAEKDIDALRDGYEARLDEELEAHFVLEVRDLLSEPELEHPSRILAALVAAGVVEFKIAVLSKRPGLSIQGRIFHDKLGIFEDCEGNVVIFKGSMNETWNGLAADGNIESVDIAATWLGDRDIERVETEARYFDTLWSDSFPGLTVRPFPAVAREELEASAAADWEAELEQCLSNEQDGDATADTRGRSLRPHQAAGLASWRAAGRRGILAFATGSGKTFMAIVAIREALMLGEVVFVVVPDKTLLAQWYQELKETTADLGASILRAGAGYNRWKDSLVHCTGGAAERVIILATIQTASSNAFLSQVKSSEQSLIVIDEVHRAGSPHHQRVLDDLKFGGARLGLSATPERAGDPSGTAAIISFFEGILEPRYGLHDAVRDGVLCRYFYRPHTVTLEDHEQDAWDDLTGRIGQLRARQGDGSEPGLEKRLKKLLIARARIVKQAAGKVQLAVDVLSEHARPEHRWIVYCDNLTQLGDVCSALGTVGLLALPFHSKMAGDRQETLRWLADEGGIVVAIKCLDEGVDVPSVSHALILASSKNPREFTQRRGRVLRRHPGKPMAFIHDAIVLPLSRPAATREDPIVAGELARALEFAASGDNPSAGADLARIAIDMGVDPGAFSVAGFEVDDDDED